MRIEIETALRRGMRVIPVLVGGGQMPSRRQLPREIQALADRQAFELRDARWHADVGDLLEALADLARDRGRAPSPRGVRASEAARVWEGAPHPGVPDPFNPAQLRALQRLPAVVADDERVMLVVYTRWGRPTVKAPSACSQ